MCGFAGLALPDGRTPPRAALERMAATIRHRGPDEDGFHQGPGVGLAFRRLSIIDLATGSQPHRQRGRQRRRRVQRRDLQLPRAAGGASRARPSLPHDQRHRSARASLRGMRGEAPRSIERDVRVRAVGRAAPHTSPGARSDRDQAAALCRNARRARLRIGDGGDSGLRRRRRVDRSGRPPAASRLGRRSRAAHHSARRAPAPSRPLRDVERGALAYSPLLASAGCGPE